MLPVILPIDPIDKLYTIIPALIYVFLFTVGRGGARWGGMARRWMGWEERERVNIGLRGVRKRLNMGMGEVFGKGELKEK